MSKHRLPQDLRSCTNPSSVQKVPKSIQRPIHPFPRRFRCCSERRRHVGKATLFKITDAQGVAVGAWQCVQSFVKPSLNIFPGWFRMHPFLCFHHRCPLFPPCTATSTADGIAGSKAGGPVKPCREDKSVWKTPSLPCQIAKHLLGHILREPPIPGKPKCRTKDMGKMTTHQFRKRNFLTLGEVAIQYFPVALHGRSHSIQPQRTKSGHVGDAVADGEVQVSLAEPATGAQRL